MTSVSTSGADTEVGFDFAYLQYASGPWEVTLGQNNMTSPMEDRAAALNTPFNERSPYINAFGFSKAMGVAVNTSGDNWSAGVGVYGDDLNNPESNNTSETVALQVRGTWAPYLEKTANGVSLVHLGATARYRDNSGGEQKGFTLQSTWQPISFLKFQLDYSRLDIERPSSPLSGQADVITMRSQIEW